MDLPAGRQGEPVVQVPVSVLERLLYERVDTIHGSALWRCRLCGAESDSPKTIGHAASCWMSPAQHSIW